LKRNETQGNIRISHCTLQQFKKMSLTCPHDSNLSRDSMDTSICQHNESVYSKTFTAVLQSIWHFQLKELLTHYIH